MGSARTSLWSCWNALRAAEVSPGEGGAPGGSLITAFVKNRSPSPGPHRHCARSGVEVDSELTRQLGEETLDELRLLEIMASSSALAKQPR